MSETITLAQVGVPVTTKYNGSFSGTYTDGQTPEFQTADVPEGKVWAVHVHINITETSA